VPLRVRLADLLAGLSIASDLGFGLPPETAMRACLIGTRLARAHGLPDEEVRDSYWASLLLHVGCPAFSHETAAAFGNELVLTRAAARTNLADPDDYERTLVRGVTRGLARGERAQLAERLLVEGPEFGRRFDTASCEVGSATARRVGLGPGVERALYEVGEWWNGEGVPRGLEEESVSAGARVARVAVDAAALDDLEGELVVAALQARAGTLLDPALVETFAANEPDIRDRTGDPREQVVAHEPEPIAERDQAGLREIAAAFGAIADLKFPALHGHSAGVASLAVEAARRLRLDERTLADLEVAAHLHDLGRLAVTNLVWEKPGPLTSAEWEQVRVHSYYSERILATSQALEALAPIVGMHHERLDGSGYHRGVSARDQPVVARLLAAADAFHAMTEDRPHRPPLAPEEAAEELRRQARAGCFDGDCTTAVLEAAGQARPGKRTALRPAGLTDRELDVLRLVATGHSNPEIAQQLVISRRTAEHHVQHIYAKVGVSSRPALALFAMEHDLL